VNIYELPLNWASRHEKIKRCMRGQKMNTQVTEVSVNQMGATKKPRESEFPLPEPARIKSPETGFSGCAGFPLGPSPLILGNNLLKTDKWTLSLPNA
jgi:hypothetical protein